MVVSAISQTDKMFNYASLDAATYQFVQQQTGEIRALIRRTAQEIIEVGQKLIEVKERLGHGQFEGWLQAEFDWTQMTANRFMRVAKQFKSNNLLDLHIAPSALYVLAAPSTPAAARTEALARAEAGELITHKAAKALKQKYALPQTAPVLSTPHSTVVASDPPGSWWRLGKKHFLYCGSPNSPEFLQRISQRIGLLLAFPPNPDWQSSILSEVRMMMAEYLPQCQNADLLDEILESHLLHHSKVGDLVVSCFLPSPDILSIINRLDRRGLFAEPNYKRCQAVLLDWKSAGLKAERLS